MAYIERRTLDPGDDPDDSNSEDDDYRQYDSSHLLPYIMSNEQRDRIIRKASIFTLPAMSTFELLAPHDARYLQLQATRFVEVKPEDLPHIQSIALSALSVADLCENALVEIMRNTYEFEFHCSYAYFDLVKILLTLGHPDYSEEVFRELLLQPDLFYHQQWGQFKKCPNDEHFDNTGTFVMWAKYSLCPVSFWNQLTKKSLDTLYHRVFVEQSSCYQFYFFFVFNYGERIDTDIGDEDDVYEDRINDRTIDFKSIQDHTDHIMSGDDGEHFFVPRVLKLIKQTFDRDQNVPWIMEIMPAFFHYYLQFFFMSIPERSVITHEEIFGMIVVFGAYCEAMWKGVKGDDVSSFINPFSTTLADTFVRLLVEDISLVGFFNWFYYKNSLAPFYWELVIAEAVTRIIGKLAPEQSTIIKKIGNYKTTDEYSDLLACLTAVVQQNMYLTPVQTKVIVTFLEELYEELKKNPAAADRVAFFDDYDDWLVEQKKFTEKEYIAKRGKSIIGFLYLSQKAVTLTGATGGGLSIGASITAHPAHDDNGPYLKLSRSNFNKLKTVLKKTGFKMISKGNRLYFPVDLSKLPTTQAT